MAYALTSPYIGAQAINVTDAVQNHPLGTTVRAVDPTFGEGEFIYLLGVVSTTVGSVVTYDVTTYQTTLAAAGANLPRAVAFAMSANVASQYGWYQISGLAVANKTKTVSMTVGIAVGVKTAGLINTTGTGKELLGALVAAVASATTTTKSGDKVKLMISRPHLQGRIT
jgi:hypothetical protein